MNQNNSKILNLLPYPFFLIFGYFIIQSYGYTMPDDGWRHLAMAFDQETIQSWGNLFIHSLYKEYDPWFLWHILLQKTSLIVGEEQTPIVINSLVYFALSSWVYTILKRYSAFNTYFMLLFSIGLPLITYRYFFLRPDVLSGLFVLYTILINRKIILALVSILYFPFYYIFWFYFGYVGFIKLILKEYKELAILFIIGVLGLVFHLGYDYQGYMDMMKNVFGNHSHIGKYAVTESKTFLIPDIFRQIFGSSKLLLILMVISVLFYFVFKPKNRLLQYSILLVPMMLVQYRFFHLLQPLVMVYALILLHQLYLEIERTSIAQVIDKAFVLMKEKTYFTAINKKWLTIICFAFFAYLFASKYMSNVSGYKTEHQMTKAAEIFKQDEFKDKSIFLTSMDGMLYRAIYFNPSGKYMPNCSIGWVDYEPNLKETYFKILTNDKKLSKNELFTFLKFNNFDYFIIRTKKRHNIAFTREEIENNGYYFQKITGDFLIFHRKIKKNKL